MSEPSRADILAAARQIGLNLPPAYEAELVSAHAHVRAMLGRIHQERPHGDEPAHAFNPLAFQPVKARGDD